MADRSVRCTFAGNGFGGWMRIEVKGSYFERNVLLWAGVAAASAEVEPEIAPGDHAPVRRGRGASARFIDVLRIGGEDDVETQGLVAGELTAHHG